MVAQHTDTVCMYANQKNVYLTELLLKKTRPLPQSAPLFTPAGAASHHQGYAAGMPFIYPPDQDQGVKDGVFIPFSVCPQRPWTSVSRIAQMTGAKVVAWHHSCVAGGRRLCADLLSGVGKLSER